jgi:hypothetical protein
MVPTVTQHLLKSPFNAAECGFHRNERYNIINQTADYQN